jgi:hypothetical protein
MLRKRARSLVNKPPPGLDDQADTAQDDPIIPEDLNETRKSDKNAAGNTKTVRAKSIENKRRQLLAQSIKFQRRNNLIRKRRA